MTRGQMPRVACATLAALSLLPACTCQETHRFIEECSIRSSSLLQHGGPLLDRSSSAWDLAEDREDAPRMRVSKIAGDATDQRLLLSQAIHEAVEASGSDDEQGLSEPGPLAVLGPELALDLTTQQRPEAEDEITKLAAALLAQTSGAKSSGGSEHSSLSGSGSSSGEDAFTKSGGITGRRSNTTKDNSTTADNSSLLRKSDHATDASSPAPAVVGETNTTAASSASTNCSLCTSKGSKCEAGVCTCYAPESDEHCDIIVPESKASNATSTVEDVTNQMLAYLPYLGISMLVCFCCFCCMEAQSFVDGGQRDDGEEMHEAWVWPQRPGQEDERSPKQQPVSNTASPASASTPSRKAPRAGPKPAPGSYRTHKFQTGEWK